MTKPRGKTTILYIFKKLKKRGHTCDDLSEKHETCFIY